MGGFEQFQVELEFSPEFEKILKRLDRVEARLEGQDETEAARRGFESSVAAVGASLRLGGCKLTDDEVAAILNHESAASSFIPEVHGYADALGHPISKSLRWTNNDLKQLHARMMGDGGESSDLRTNSVYREAFSAEGVALGRIFQTLPPRLIEEKVQSLMDWYNDYRILDSTQIPVLAGVVSLGLLAASPFERGNGRFSRLMFVKLLQQQGYRLFDHAAWEPSVESTREDYYESYDLAATHLWAGNADVTPWTSYLLRTIADQMDRAERLNQHQPTMELGSLSSLQRRILETLAGQEPLQAAHLMESTGANRNTLKDNMRKLVENGWVEKIGERRGTRYRLLADTLSTPFER